MSAQLKRSLKLKRSINQKKLKERQQNEPTTKYDIEKSKRQQIAEFAFTFFVHHLRPESSVPLHFLFRCDSVQYLKQSFQANPRRAIVSALQKPSTCGLGNDSKQVSPSWEDTCILYSFFCQAGPKLINLYDWYNYFCAILSEESSDELKVRFVQALNELVLLGFIDKTNRKADHVSRLII